MRRDSERISDILEACALVASYIESQTSTDFEFNSLFRDAVIASGYSLAGDCRISEQDRTRLFRLQSRYRTAGRYEKPPRTEEATLFNPGGRVS
jgi:hypothetical protein